MTRKECFEALELPIGTPLGEIKRSYRRLAFALHPDLNPDVPDAARRFQRLNEAYVLLTKGGAEAERPGEPDAKAREEAHKAYAKADARRPEPAGAARAGTAAGAGRQGKAKEDVLKDILDDPFARRVFEDIYSHIRNERPSTPGAEQRKAPPRPALQPRRQAVRKKDAGDGLMTKVSGWFRRQIDDEQVLRLPGAHLVPGAKVRLEITHGLAGESETVELTLPPEFVPGRAIRLKGMGKRLGKWRGDLYVRIEAV